MTCAIAHMCITMYVCETARLVALSCSLVGNVPPSVLTLAEFNMRERILYNT